MPSSISRGPITTALISRLEEASFPVGDNAMPEDSHGWTGEPGSESSTFTPWMSLQGGTAVPQQPSGGMGDTGTEWKLFYNVFYAGVTRKQQDALADKMRENLTNITRASIETDTGNWMIQKVSCTALGNSTRIGSAYPDYYTQTDSFELWISKER